MNSLNFHSFNVRGLRDHKKRWEIFHWLKKSHRGKDYIHLLQETHSTENDVDTWRKEWGADIFLSHGDSNSKGVAFLLPHINVLKLSNLELY